ncbi:helix-turn-helix transcriptional regulator [bacterium]|nr:helix-turn-helix transcriptional regulator [bacterium]
MQGVESNYYKIIAKNIKLLRLGKKLSQEKFAETISCSREYISRLENNKEKISLAMLLHISEIYQLKPEDFFKH